MLFTFDGCLVSDNGAMPLNSFKEADKFYNIMVSEDLFRRACPIAMLSCHVYDGAAYCNATYACAIGHVSDVLWRFC